MEVVRAGVSTFKAGMEVLILGVWSKVKCSRSTGLKPYRCKTKEKTKYNDAHCNLIIIKHSLEIINASANPGMTKNKIK